MADREREITPAWLFLIASVLGLAMVLPDLTSSPAWWTVVTAIALGALAVTLAVRIAVSLIRDARRRRAPR